MVVWNIDVDVSDIHRMCGSLFACQLTMTESLFSTGVPLCLSVYYIRKVKRPSRWLISAIIMIINNNGQSEWERAIEKNSVQGHVFVNSFRTNWTGTSVSNDQTSPVAATDEPYRYGLCKQNSWPTNSKHRTYTTI